MQCCINIFMAAKSLLSFQDVKLSITELEHPVDFKKSIAGRSGVEVLLILPVNFLSSSSISSFPFDFGILPRNKRVFGSLTFNFRFLPSAISYESSCRG